MKNLLIAAFFVVFSIICYSQRSRIGASKYPSLLWEITGNGLTKPSYLFGTMHVSSKMVFHLSDSFYVALRNVQVVALETNPGTWQDDFSRYNLDGDGGGRSFFHFSSLETSQPEEYFTINTLKFTPYEKILEKALYSSPSIINSFLYRSNSESSSDFEEDTYLDMHIFQMGKKLGKKVCGVEDFDQSMELVKEAYADAAKEKILKDKSSDYDEEFSYAKLEDAYRTGNLDLLDTINKLNSTSPAFDEKFLYRRNDIQAHSIDSILRTKQSLFVGVGAAHLPGQRGVIEYLRRHGYTLRPIKMNERSSKQKDEIAHIRVPVQFSKQVADDGFFSVNLPGKLYSFSRPSDGFSTQQYADMTNGSYYIITRVFTDAAIWGDTPQKVSQKIDSVLYENIPGKIINKKLITKNGCPGFDITNRTRRGDVQRYNIFITPFEVIIFKISGNGDYVTGGKEADQFFSSIQFKDAKPEWKKFSPATGGFVVEMPNEPTIINSDNWYYMTWDSQSSTSFQVIRTDIHNYNFVEEDSFDLNLMEESFSSSEFIDKQLSRKFINVDGYPALDVKYKCKDGVAQVRFLIQGVHYYTIVAKSKAENNNMNRFINSFSIKPFIYKNAESQKESSLFFSVKSPVPVIKKKKLDMYSEEQYRDALADPDDSLVEKGKFGDKVIDDDSTGEKIYVSFYKPSKYYFEDSTEKDDSAFYKDWVFKSKKAYDLPDKIKVFEYRLGNKNSSRILQGKSFSKDGIVFNIQTQVDSITKPSAFISNFFNTFTPADTLTGVNVFEKKSKIFFSDFFSSDSILHRKALKNAETVDFDDADFTQLKKAILSLSWKEKKYLDAKKSMIATLSHTRSHDASDFLKAIYYNAADTVEFQYAALKTLLDQKTKYAYQVFADIMQNDPPVLNTPNSIPFDFRKLINADGGTSIFHFNFTGESYQRNELFLDGLTDSLQLTASIYKKLLPLIDLSDYESSMLNLTGDLLAKGLIKPDDYKAYFSKFFLEAKQLLKKQMIKEKNISIENAEKDAADKRGEENDDKGNSRLSLYSVLLTPYWNEDAAVPNLLHQLLNSNDKRLKYNTAIVLLRNKRDVPQALISEFAASDEYRLELYRDLKKNNLMKFFPSQYNNQVDIARSMVANIKSQSKIDSIILLSKVSAEVNDKNGFVYFFKYKEKKGDSFWKIASAGLFPPEANQMEFEEKNDIDLSNLTTTRLSTDTPVSEQINKELKKLLYSKRKSSAQFYAENLREFYAD